MLLLYLQIKEVYSRGILAAKWSGVKWIRINFNLISPWQRREERRRGMLCNDDNGEWQIKRKMGQRRFSCDREDDLQFHLKQLNLLQVIMRQSFFYSFPFFLYSAFMVTAESYDMIIIYIFFLSLSNYYFHHYIVLEGNLRPYLRSSSVFHSFFHSYFCGLFYVECSSAWIKTYNWPLVGSFLNFAGGLFVVIYHKLRASSH